MIQRNVSHVRAWENVIGVVAQVNVIVVVALGYMMKKPVLCVMAQVNVTHARVRDCVCGAVEKELLLEE
jgi:hypothetical protein